MLTRFKVDGFKNLVAIDLHFGPFTCIAGPNGIGKSNLLDAISFLSALSHQPLLEAASRIRSDHGRFGDIKGLFHRSRGGSSARMRFEAEMIIPHEGFDDLGQRAEAAISYLRYVLELRYREDESYGSMGGLEIVYESLEPIRLGDAAGNLGFDHSSTWRKSVLRGKRSGSPFLSTTTSEGPKYVRLHQDGIQGKPRNLVASTLPRTVLSSTNAAESPTATLARKEMESWRILQLEPSLLREPDSFNAPARLSANGAHLAATLYRMTGMRTNGNGSSGDASSRYARIANRLAELYEDVDGLWVDRDEKRELLTLFVRTREGDEFPARALSDGTLRFLALSVLESDDAATGLLCLEEPENGIHPHRIPYVIRLLEDMATDVSEAVSSDNPLRQVIVNTHSPIVAANVVEDSLLLAIPKKVVAGHTLGKRLAFQCVPRTWRDNGKLAEPMPPGAIEEYLGALGPEDLPADARRVKDVFEPAGQFRRSGR